jgi:2-polyprenyl-3-methyl-5-hydroxy-6-metoxy-1,4-benzoquinol methylase
MQRMDAQATTLDPYAEIRAAESRTYADEARARSAEMKAAAAAEREAYPPLETWPMLPEAQRRVYVADPDTLRCGRTRALVGRDRHVLDIGGGRGYVAGLLLRDSALASYTGFDLWEEFPASFEEMLQANQLEGVTDTYVETKDLYTLNAEWVARRPPNLALCFEVLEHVPDAEGALRVIAASLPVGCVLAFSVPLHGRLEDVFDHLSIFDANRVDGMLRAAGLELVSAEPVANRWALIVANKPESPPEAAPVPSRGVTAAPDPYVHVTDPSQVRAVGPARARRDGTTVQVSIARAPSRADRIRDFVGRAQRKVRRHLPVRYRRFIPLLKKRPLTPTQAGLQARVQGTLARALLGVLGPDGQPLAAADTHLEARAMSGDRCLARWICDAPRKPLPQPYKLVLRRGTTRPPFEAVGTHDTETPADRIEVLATVTGAQRITLSLDLIGWAWR